MFSSSSCSSISVVTFSDDVVCLVGRVERVDSDDGPSCRFTELVEIWCCIGHSMLGPSWGVRESKLAGSIKNDSEFSFYIYIYMRLLRIFVWWINKVNIIMNLMHVSSMIYTCMYIYIYLPLAVSIPDGRPHKLGRPSKLSNKSCSFRLGEEGFFPPPVLGCKMALLFSFAAIKYIKINLQFKTI